MILIDTSVWIDFFNGFENKAVSILEQLVWNEEDIYLSEYILTEVMQGFRHDEDYELARKYLFRFDRRRIISGYSCPGFNTA